MSKVTGTEELLFNLKQIDENTDEVLLKSVKKATGFVRDDARLRVSVNTGDLRRSIFDDLQRTNEGVLGKVSTNSDHAMYVEFGTGPNGEEEHEGISPEVNPQYSQRGWIIPAKAMSKETAELYGLGIVEKNGEMIGYRTNGQPARPFLYPALADNLDQIQRNIAKDLASAIKKGIKK